MNEFKQVADKLAEASLYIVQLHELLDKAKRVVVIANTLVLDAERMLLQEADR